MGGVGFPVVLIRWHDVLIFFREKKEKKRCRDEEMSREPAR